MKKTLVALTTLTILATFAGSAFADTSGLIPCGNTQANGAVTDGCTYVDVIILAQTIIKFLIFDLAAPIAVVMFAYAGFLYVTNGGNESKIKQAHEIFLYVFWGLLIALSAWLLVNFILNFLVDPTFNFLG
jgi:hypothetical protein